MTGPLALHGGGEFLSGDEPFLRHLLELASIAAREAHADDTIRVELLTTAIARHRPDLAFAVGSAALERVATEAAVADPSAVPGGRRLAIGHARVVDDVSARDGAIAALLAAADLVYLPGGDPDTVLEILAGSAAWEGVAAARDRGAVVAGASAGAMALGEQTWTRRGYMAGFGWAGRLVVVPHATEERVATLRPTIERLPNGAGLAILGLPERTGVTGHPGAWTVAGSAGAWWWPPHAPAPVHQPQGAAIRS